MFIDARTLEAGKKLEYDLAIIGGGPAGITLAREFINTKQTVCLIESGGMAPSKETQSLYEGESVGQSYSLRASRLRYFGGSSNHWGGFCRPLTQLDFEKRDWVPHSGWPIQRAELDPYYRRALPILQLGPYEFEDPSYWSKISGDPVPEYPLGRFSSKFVHFSVGPTSPLRFGQHYKDELEKAKNVSVLLHANLTEIDLVKNGQSASGLAVQTLSGKKFQVAAKKYVLAAGGIENPRILLSSASTQKEGIGNAKDLVGRFFTDHPIFIGPIRAYIAKPEKNLPSYHNNRVKLDGTYLRGYYRPDEEYLRKHRLLDISLAMRPGKEKSYLRSEWTERASHRVFRSIRNFLRPAPDDHMKVIGKYMGTGGSCEIAPNPNSRIQLSDKTDRLGMPTARLNWQLSRSDLKSLQKHLHSLALEVGAMGIGRISISKQWATIDEWPEEVSWASHHIGTTRMAENPRSGVVDKNCKVFGIDNLYIAGSSVFTTGGVSNPTFTIVALALRLADHLKKGKELHV